MKFRSSVVVLLAVSSVLFVEVVYLKVLPGSFVRIYYTSDPREFNKMPTKAMTVAIDGYFFNYCIPHSMREDILKEVKDLIQNDSLNTVDSLIVIANWVREKLKFGTPDYNSDGILVEDILNNGKNEELSVMCGYYSRLFVIACQWLDIPARIIELRGHLVPEAFIREIDKWVMIDPTNGYYMSKDGELISVAEIITYYKKGIQLTTIVFAKEKGNDCLYRTEDEINLKKIYLNGFTVVSDQNVGRKSIKGTILNTLQLPIAKMQFVNTNSTLIGKKEKWLRYAIMLTVIACIIVSIATMIKR